MHEQIALYFELTKDRYTHLESFRYTPSEFPINCNSEFNIWNSLSGLNLPIATCINMDSCV